MSTYGWIETSGLLLAEQVGHGLGARVAGVVQAGYAEATLDRAQQREVGVELSALQPWKP